MEEKLREIDALLASINVSGDGVIALASARMKLKEIFDTVRKDEAK